MGGGLKYCVCLIFALFFKATTITLKHLGESATQSHCLRDDANATETKAYRTLQVQLVLRHGDRSPITKLKDENFWASTLVPKETIMKIEEGIKITRNELSDIAHQGAGVGPFGKLTRLGLLQMVQVGAKIRAELVCDQKDELHPAEVSNKHTGYIWTNGQTPTARDIQILSTDFPRTIQSVQGFLVGLFPDGAGEQIEIDCRHTNWLIPDPQPRNSKEQEVLECFLSTQPHILEREAELRPFAKRLTTSLLPLLADEAFDISFGLEESSHKKGERGEKLLSWVQLLEITKCLRVRGKLPKEISDDDLSAIAKHTTWKWLQIQRNPRLAYLSMNKFTSYITKKMRNYRMGPALTIYSCHDSTLIGLMSAFRLKQPSQWPDYASYMKIELLEVTGNLDEPIEHMVRFYLNGSILHSDWLGKTRSEIPLSLLEGSLEKVAE